MVTCVVKQCKIRQRGHSWSESEGRRIESKSEEEKKKVLTIDI